MKKSLFLTAICFCLVSAVPAQKTKQEKGFFNITTLGELQLFRSIDSTSVADGKTAVKSGFELNTINGIFLNPHISVGLGVGIQFVKYESAYAEGYGVGPEANIGPGIQAIPVFADFRYYPVNKRNAPMLILDAGYAIFTKGINQAEKYQNGGALFKVGGGYKIHLGDAVSLLPSVNFRAQMFGENTAVGGAIGLALMF